MPAFRSHPACRAASLTLTLSLVLLSMSLSDVVAQSPQDDVDAQSPQDDGVIPSPQDELQQAQTDFLVGETDTARRTVDALIDSGALFGDDLRDSYVLLARCELRVRRPEAAADAFCAVLRIDPGWRPDQTLFTADEQAYFFDARSKCGADAGATAVPATPSAEPLPAATDDSGGGAWYTSPIFLIGSAAAVAGIAIAALSGGSEDEPQQDPLPPFPDPPADQ